MPPELSLLITRNFSGRTLNSVLRTSLACIPRLAEIKEVIAEATALLDRARVDQPRRTSEVLLAHSLGVDRTYLVTHPKASLSLDVLESFKVLVERRAAHEPLQYIVGHQEFYGFQFKVTPDVLIPRPETEHLVETVLKLARGVPNDTGHASPMIVDVGTGSGCIAITVALLVHKARVIAIDISSAALQVAAENVNAHNAGSRVELLEGDLLQPLLRRNVNGAVDIIASNPPYVPLMQMASLQREVGEHEPRVALSGGRDGLDFYRRLLIEAPLLLKPNGYLVFEIGFGQLDSVRSMIDDSWELLEITSDLQGIPRTLTLQKGSPE